MSFAALECRHWRVWAKFVAGCLLILALSSGGISFLFNIELKTLFHLSQTKVGILAGHYMMGIYFVLPYAVLHKRCGFYVSFLIASLMTFAGFLLIATAALIPETFKNLPFFLYLFIYMLSNGRCGIYFLVTLTTMTTIPKGKRGKAVGCIGAMVFFGELIASPIYKAYFAYTSETAKYFFVCTGLAAVMLSLYILVYVVTGGVETRTEETPLIENDEKICNDSIKSPLVQNTNNKLADVINPVQKNHECKEDVSFKDMFSSVIFHLYLWSGGIIMACSLLYFTNVCLLLQSLDMRQYQDSVVTTMILSVALSHLLSGVLYDAFQKTSTKVTLLIAATVTNVLSFGVILICMNSIVVVFISVVFMGGTLGGGFSTYLNFSPNIFGHSNLGMVQGVLLTCYEIFGLVFSVLSGKIYDFFALKNSAVEVYICYGTECYWWTWLITFFISLLVTSLPVLLWYKVKRNERTCFT